jgi:hypothetical protein
MPTAEPRRVEARAFSAQYADDDQDHQDDEQRSETDVHVATSQLIGGSVPDTAWIETPFE